MAEPTVVETPTPEPTQEAFASAAEHAEYYNRQERAIPTIAVPDEPPTPEPLPPAAAEPTSPPAEAGAATPSEPDDTADDLPDAKLYFRSPDGTFRKAKGSEIRSKLRETVDQLRQKNRELQALAHRQPEPTPATSLAPEPSGELGARPDLDDYPDLKAWQAADAEWIRQAIAAERAHAERTTQTRLAEDAFRTRLTKFKDAHPDWDEAVQAVDDIQFPPLFASLFTQDERAPEMMYYLAKHPDDYAQLVLMNASTPVTDSTVGVLRRLLLSRLDAATNGTGTASSAVLHRPAAAPIAPVRTSSPVATDRPPGDDASAREHFEYYNRQEREARQRR